jgi:hypothetical protein
VSAPVPQPLSPLSVASAAAQIQPRFTLPSPSGSSDPFVTVPARALPDLLSAGAAAAPPFVASATPLSMATSQSVGASNVASLEAWASYYERVSLEWLQRWGVTRDPQALASHELAAQYALGCRKCLSENNSNHRSNLPTDNQSSYSSLFCNIDARTRIEVGGRAAAPGTISIAADQQRAAAPQVEIFPQAAAAPAQVANGVDAAAPVNPVVGGFGAGLLAIIVRAAVTMCACLRPRASLVMLSVRNAISRYILSSSQPNGRMGWAVFACIIIYLINSDRFDRLLFSPDCFSALTTYSAFQALLFAQACVSRHAFLQCAGPECGALCRARMAAAGLYQGVLAPRTWILRVNCTATLCIR